MSVIGICTAVVHGVLEVFGWKRVFFRVGEGLGFGSQIDNLALDR